jgi:hypothetical protein
LCAAAARELHFAGQHQPRPLADNARDYLTGLLDMNPVAYKPPALLAVKPAALHDGRRGYILSRALECPEAELLTFLWEHLYESRPFVRRMQDQASKVLGRFAARLSTIRSTGRCRRWESNPHSPEGTGFLSLARLSR